MPQGYIDVPLTSRQRQMGPAATPEPAQDFEDVPLDDAESGPRPEMNFAIVNGERVPLSTGEQVVDAGKEFIRHVNPVPGIDAIGRMAIPAAVGEASGLGKTGPAAAWEQYSQAQEVPFNRMREAYDAGDLGTAAVQGLYWLLPLIGPVLSEAGEDFERGEWGKGVGKSAGLGFATFLPQWLAGKTAKTPTVKPKNPAEAAAVEFGLREGVPVDAGTATGNRFVRGTQRLADESMGGSVVAERAQQTQADALTATGQRLADRAHPSSVMPEQAGQGVRDVVTRAAADQHATATQAYDKLRAFEQQQAQVIARTGGVQGPATSARPFTNVPMAVDIAPTKSAMRPLYDALKQENAVVPFISGSDKGKALVALERLMNAPDMAPLSIADSALSELKAFARVDQAFRRTTGQGHGAQAVTSLEQAVRATAQQAERLSGQPVMQWLMEGRAATVNKYKAIEVLDRLRAEPVQVFRQATYANDAGVAQLREVARLAPNELPKVGRAFLDDLLTKATGEGAFDHAQRLSADWQRLGPQTKRMLFKDPGLIADLDKFFHLAKMLARHPNPSRTAITLWQGGELALLVSNPAVGAPLSIGQTALSKLLHSPRFVRALNRGLRMPISNRAGTTATVTELLSAAEQAKGNLRLAPAAAEGTEPAGRRQ